MTSTAAVPTTWSIDPTHSLVEFSVKHMMITTVKGRFGAVSGSISLDPAAPRVEAAIDVTSIDTRTEQRDQHLRSPDFFDVAKYPAIAFTSRRIDGRFAKAGDEFRIVGDLTIKGIAREVTLNAVFEGEGKDPWGGSRVSFSAITKINRHEFGLEWNQTLETGGVLVSAEVKISLEIQAIQA